MLAKWEKVVENTRGGRTRQETQGDDGCRREGIKADTRKGIRGGPSHVTPPVLCLHDPARDSVTAHDPNDPLNHHRNWLL